MSDRIELPEELRHLMEKREAERRQATGDQATSDTEQLPTGEERRSGDRRTE